MDCITQSRQTHVIKIFDFFTQLSYLTKRKTFGDNRQFQAAAGTTL
jgi:hypothetical protein